MKINTIKIKNFRGIPDMEISLERISFFTGPCGAGKTSVLKAFNFALTGDVKKDDIREQSDRASATIVFEDQSSIQKEEMIIWPMDNCYIPVKFPVKVLISHYLILD